MGGDGPRDLLTPSDHGNGDMTAAAEEQNDYSGYTVQVLREARCDEHLSHLTLAYTTDQLAAERMFAALLGEAPLHVTPVSDDVDNLHHWGAGQGASLFVRIGPGDRSADLYRALRTAAGASSWSSSLSPGLTWGPHVSSWSLAELGAACLGLRYRVLAIYSRRDNTVLARRTLPRLRPPKRPRTR